VIHLLGGTQILVIGPRNPCNHRPKFQTKFGVPKEESDRPKLGLPTDPMSIPIPLQYPARAWFFGGRLEREKLALRIEYDLEGGQLYVHRRGASRIDVTSSRDALNGYQKGKCFYCFIDISIESVDDDLDDVDHFLPHVLKERREIRNPNGVWNLVLACQTYNRNTLAREPQVKYLTRLNTRNNYLIYSHHPLADTDTPGR